MTEESITEPITESPINPQIPPNIEPTIIYRKEPASNVYVCECGHQWRTSAKNPMCAKCNSPKTPRIATIEEKRAFNRKMKKKPEQPIERGKVNNTQQAISPALVSQFSGGDNEFMTPEVLKPELKKPEEVTPVLQGVGMSPAPANTKIGSKLNFKALVMWGCIAGVVGAGWILLKAKMEKIKSVPRRGRSGRVTRQEPTAAPETTAAPEEEAPVFTILDTPAGFS